MRSTDEMKRLVKREAANRRSRRRALLSGGVGAVALVLITAAVARGGTGPGDAADVSISTDGAAPADPASTASTAPEAETGGASIAAGETGDTVVVIGPDGSPSVTIPRSGAPRPSTTTSSPTADDGTPAPAPTVTTERPPTSSDPTTTTTADPTDDGNPLPPQTRTCTPDDIVRIPLEVFVPSAPAWTEGAIPVGHVVQFGFSTLARADITPCETADSRQVLTITDSSGTEVFRHTTGVDAGRLITPGSWVMFLGTITWDPTCLTPAPEPIVWDCHPVGAGSYTVHLTDQGVVFDPKGLSIGPP